MSLVNRIVPARGPHAFARLYARAIRRRFNQRVQYDPESFSLKWGEHRSMLQNAYSDYLRVPFWQRKAVVNAYVSAIGETDAHPSTFEEARSSLLPRLVERFYVEHMRLLSAIEPFSAEMIPQVRELTTDRVMAIVIDAPKSVQYVGRKTLDDWEKTLDDLVPLAVDNLWAISKRDFVSPAPGVWMSPYRDTHDPSRLILHDLIWQLGVKGQHVAITPDRNTLLVTGSDDEPGLIAAMAIAERVLHEGSRPIDGRLLRLEDRTWTTWLPPHEKPSRTKADELLILSAMAEYAEQKAALDAVHQREGTDIFVASYHAFRLKDGSMTAASVWTDAIPTLLPKSPRVVLNRRIGGQHVQIGEFLWADLERVCEGLAKPIGLYPERYSVNQFPDEATIRSLEPQTA